MVAPKKSIFITLVLAFLMSGCAGQLADMIKKSREKDYNGYVERLEKERSARDPEYAEQMKKRKELIIAETLSGKRPLAAESILKQLKGEYKGSACNGRNPVQIDITDAVKLDEVDGYNTRSGIVIYLYGKLRITDPQGKKIETNLRGILNLYGGLLSLHSINQPTMKDYIEEVMVTNLGTGNEGMRIVIEPLGHMILNRAKSDTSKLSKYEKKLGTQTQYGGGITPSPIIPISINLARDPQGKGWVGSFEAEGFTGCDELSMVSDDGNRTSIFPPVTRNLAIRYGSINKSLFNQIYWLKVIEKLSNDDEVALAIASTYEEMGKISPQYYQLALQYYLRNANKIGDARAQKALDHIYREGLGTEKNLEEAKKWRSLAAKTNKASADICASPKTIAAIDSIMKDERNKLRLMETGLAVFTGISMNTGNVRLVRVSPDEVISLDKPFLCRVVGKRIDPTVDASGVPSFIYGGADTNGVEYFYDNRLDKAGKTVIAGITETMAKNFPYLDSFRIEPLGNRKYILSPANRSRQYSVPIDLP